VQPHTLSVPAPPHVCGAAQLPQASILPQPSGTLPQLLPSPAQVAGVQPHTLALPLTPPPQLCGAVQLPQLSVIPQPSLTVPQFLPCAMQLIGMHTATPQMLGPLAAAVLPRTGMARRR